MGISATVIDPADLGALERALEEHDVRGRGGGGAGEAGLRLACHGLPSVMLAAAAAVAACAWHSSCGCYLLLPRPICHVSW